MTAVPHTDVATHRTTPSQAAGCSRQSRQQRVTIVVMLILSRVLFTCLMAGRDLSAVCRVGGGLSETKA